MGFIETSATGLLRNSLVHCDRDETATCLGSKIWYFPSKNRCETGSRSKISICLNCVYMNMSSTMISSLSFIMNMLFFSASLNEKKAYISIDLLQSASESKLRNAEAQASELWYMVRISLESPRTRRLRPAYPTWANGPRPETAREPPKKAQTIFCGKPGVEKSM